jgi:hypothetical protein
MACKSLTLGRLTDVRCVHYHGQVYAHLLCKPCCASNSCQWCQGLKAYVHDVTQTHALLRGEASNVFADSGYRGVDKNQEVQAQHPQVNLRIGQANPLAVGEPTLMGG